MNEVLGNHSWVSAHPCLLAIISLHWTVQYLTVSIFIFHVLLWNMLVNHQLKMYWPTPLSTIMANVVCPCLTFNIDQHTSWNYNKQILCCKYYCGKEQNYLQGRTKIYNTCRKNYIQQDCARMDLQTARESQEFYTNFKNNQYCHKHSLWGCVLLPTASCSWLCVHHPTCAHILLDGADSSYNRLKLNGRIGNLLGWAGPFSMCSLCNRTLI